MAGASEAGAPRRPLVQMPVAESISGLVFRRRWRTNAITSAVAVTRITGIAAERVLVVIERSPARFAVEGGRVLPEPGHEQAWIAGSR